MPDKVKAAEAEEVTFPNPHLDSNSSGITFTIYSGIPSGSSPTGGGEPIGLGGGVDDNGNWTSGVLASCQEAFAAAAGHEHTVDRVEAITGPVGLAIGGC